MLEIKTKLHEAQKQLATLGHAPTTEQEISLPLPLEQFQAQGWPTSQFNSGVEACPSVSSVSTDAISAFSGHTDVGSTRSSDVPTEFSSQRSERDAHTGLMRSERRILSEEVIEENGDELMIASLKGSQGNHTGGIVID